MTMPVKTTDAVTLKRWLDNGEAVLVDVREPAEYAAARIAAATPVPLASVCIAALPAAPGKKLVVHCHAGVRSRTACEKLLAEDPNLNVYNLAGGISAWAQAGLPVETGGGAPVSFCAIK